MPVQSPLSWRAVAASLGGGDARETIARRLSVLYAMPRAVLTDCGTSALAVALRAAADRRAGYCLLPAYGCYDLATAALAAGVRVAFYDIEPTTLAPRMETLVPRLGNGCAALVIVHHYGLVTDLDEIRRLASAAGVALIEDAAQAAGSFWAGERAGKRADAVVLSFGRGKGVTGGGGGALLIGNTSIGAELGALIPALPERVEGRAMFAAKLAVQHLFARPGVYGIPASIPMLRLGETVFREPALPSTMTRQAAGVLTHTLGTMDEDAERRRTIADQLRASQAGAKSPWMIVQDSRSRPGWLRLPVLVQGSGVVDAGEASRLGIAPGYPRPLPTLSQLHERVEGRDDFSGAQSLCERLWTLPTHAALESDDTHRLIQWLDRR